MTNNAFTTNTRNRANLYAAHRIEHGAGGQRTTARILLASLQNIHPELAADYAAPAVAGPGEAMRQVTAAVSGRDYLEEATQAVINGEDPDALLALHAGAQYRGQIAERIQNAEMDRWVKHIESGADHIITTLANDVFEPTIDTMRELVEQHGADLDVNAAVKAGDYAKAAAIDHAQEAIMKLAALEDVRQMLHNNAFAGTAAWATTRDAFGGIGAPTSRMWGNTATQTPNFHRVQWWALVIEAGAVPHWPTLAAWDQLRRAHAQEEADERAEDDGVLIPAQ